jgi:hypothetical protein
MKRSGREVKCTNKLLCNPVGRITRGVVKDAPGAQRSGLISGQGKEWGKQNHRGRKEEVRSDEQQCGEDWDLGSTEW